MEPPPRPTSPEPPCRRLRVFAVDPSQQAVLDTWEVNQAVLSVRWEPDLQPGPTGEYLEVVDVDPASGRAYPPVDLNDHHLLAQDGHSPSDGNPEFHQQMAYAVAMKTIHHFEHALGRRSLWSPRTDFQNRPDSLQGEQRTQWEYVRRLRIYPHALREANAYYSPEKKALLFGYFPAPLESAGDHLPGGLVFTCLSHDIVAHETAHALLDGMHRRLIEPTNPDVLAFHEAFADIIALFQHFTLPEVLRHQVARTRGNLRRQNMLGELAQQFGAAVGRHGALRSALGEWDEQTGVWRPAQPDPEDMQRIFEPHERGAILVGAVFDAFLSMYQSRVADLLRIATGGTGVLPEGAIHPDLVTRLSEEAARTAAHVLTICIRALDYLPPADLTFGEYLRALITADVTMVPNDRRGYRVALIEAFRRRGIFPRRVRTLSEEMLCWSRPASDQAVELDFEAIARHGFPPFRNQPVPRDDIYRSMQARGQAIHSWLKTQSEDRFRRFGLRKDLPFEVHAVRLGRRAGPTGNIVTEVFVQITQQRAGYLDDAAQARAWERVEHAGGDFAFRGGCTLVIDPDKMTIKQAIIKSIDSRDRLERQRRYLGGDIRGSLRATYFGEDSQEPFALLHRSHEGEV